MTDVRARVRGSLRRVLRWARDRRTLLLAVLAYTAVLGSIATFRYYTGQTFAWDLGIMQQSLYSAAFHGRFFYYTPELYNKNPSGSFFGVHFSLMMFPLAGFYRLFPSGPALLYLQPFVVAVAILPLVRLCRALGCPRPELFAALYLLSPLTVLSDLYDFHLEAFVPLGVFALLLALVEGRRLPAVLASVYLLSIYEYGAVFVVACVAIYALLRYRELLAFVRAPRAAPPAHRTIVALAAGLTAASAAFYVLAFDAIYAVNPTLRSLNGGFSPARLSASLGNVWASDPWLLLIYFGLPFLVLAFLPARDPRPLVLVALFAVPALLSDTSYYYYGVQYGFLIVPGYILAAALGLRRADRSAPAAAPRRRRWLGPATVTASAVSVVAIVALASVAGYSAWFATGALFTGETPWNQAEYHLASEIPAGASVLVDDNAFPWVANNLRAYVIPLDLQPSPVSFYETINETLHVDAEYVLLNTVEFGLFPYYQNFSGFVQANYGLLAEDGGNVLLEWHYGGPMSFGSGYTLTYPSTSFVEKTPGPNSTVYWAGPYANTIAGRYVATVDYRSGAAATVEVTVSAFNGTVVLNTSSVEVHATGGGTAAFTVGFLSPFLYDAVQVQVGVQPGLALTATGATITQTGP